ncbi:MAG: ATP-binding protein [Reichenbachiella sp.]|uniref:ATP-binding protein n=1 Tax=Reichenbachiella sp. TaxID=2184521 RepID=UPI00326607B0
MNKTEIISLLGESDVRLATELTSLKATEMGFEVTSIAEMALAVSEISQNVIRYAGVGKAIFERQKGGLTVTIKDEGPGIENLEKASQRGYSSLKNSLGVGLGVARRSVDEFKIKTDKESGTEVTLRKFLPIPEDQIEYGVVSFADENYAVNGDDYLIKEYDGDKVLLAVIDGTGEGYPAHTVALIIKEYLFDNYRLSLEELANNCHRILKKSDIERGATVALAKIESGCLRYLGIGDTHAYLLGEEMNQLHNHEGTIGQYHLPTLKTREKELGDNTYLILCTDGIKTSLWMDEDQFVSAQQLANSIFREFHKEYGDVTVLVAKHITGL